MALTRLDHVALRSVVRAKAGASSPGGFAQRILDHVVGRRAIARMVALQAQLRLSRVGDDRAVPERHRRQHSDQVRIVGRDGFAVRLVAGLAADRRVGGVGRRKIRDRAAGQRCWKRCC